MNAENLERLAQAALRSNGAATKQQVTAAFQLVSPSHQQDILQRYKAKLGTNDELPLDLEVAFGTAHPDVRQTFLQDEELFKKLDKQRLLRLPYWDAHNDVLDTYHQMQWSGIPNDYYFNRLVDQANLIRTSSPNLRVAVKHHASEFFRNPGRLANFVDRLGASVRADNITYPYVQIVDPVAEVSNHAMQTISIGRGLNSRPDGDIILEVSQHARFREPQTTPIAEFVYGYLREYKESGGKNVFSFCLIPSSSTIFYDSVRGLPKDSPIRRSLTTRPYKFIDVICDVFQSKEF